MTTLSWIFAALSVTGTWLNIKKRRVCFIIWGFTNGFWFVYDMAIGAYAQSALFAVYFILALRGLWEWSRELEREGK